MPDTYLSADPTAVPDAFTAPAYATVYPLVSVPRLPSSVAAVPEASQRTAQKRTKTPETYLFAYPTAVPVSFTAEAFALVTPLESVPKFPSSVAAVPAAAQRTAREPVSVPATYFSAYPTAVPASFTAMARATVAPNVSVPTFPSSVAVPT